MSEWRKFNKEDETTWPAKGGCSTLWVFRDGEARLIDWLARPNKWPSGVTHWMPIKTPEPPR